MQKIKNITAQTEKKQKHYELDKVLDGAGGKPRSMACESKCIKCDVSSKKAKYS